MQIVDWMKTMRLEFGMFEFRAVSPQGHIVQSEGWKEHDDSKAVIPSESHVMAKK